MRNSIAHHRFEIINGYKSIQGIRFTDNNQLDKLTFDCKMSIAELRTFVNEISNIFIAKMKES